MRPNVACLLALGILQALAGAAAVTIYHQKNNPSATATASSAAASYTGAAAYNPTVLQPPPVPSPLNTQFVVQLQNGGTPGASIQQSGSFFGFSIEMSVANQVLGKNSTHIQVPFLNLMANLQQRSGRINIRVGGNTQEAAVLVDSTPDGRILEKDIAGASNPTQTPPLVFTPDLLYMMRNISNFVNVRWFLGVPFNDTSNFRLAIAEQGQAILGDYLIGLQAGNEPDLYARHGHRPSTYGPYDYVGEFGNLVNAMSNDANAKNRNLLIGPNIAYADWTTEMVWNTGFVDQFSNNLAYLAVENYPTDNCAAQFNTGGTIHNPQDVFPTFLDHNAGKGIIEKFRNSTDFAQQKGKKLLMFETNTASCGGFPGVSDSFGAALWGIDYALQMAHSNFSGALMHIGPTVYKCTASLSTPTNQSSFHQWTIGPLYYSALAVAETLGFSNTSQIMDLNANGGDVHTPAYAVYENGNPVRVGIVNFVTDPSGASDLQVQIAVGGSGIGQPNQSPSQVKVKYLLAPSVSQKGNYTWAGQTFGGIFQSDGRPMGTENVTTVPCDSTTNLCTVRVPAPSYALVFLSDDALAQSDGKAAPSTTFSTSMFTNTRNTATVDPSVLATSNGGFDKSRMGSTSPGSSSSGAGRTRAVLGQGVVSVFAAVVAGWVLVGRVR
ncbi:putative glycosyl hydrolase family 79 C-terminal beta domain [Lyophyllum shimeji]|uniref:Glycosyl hydrolase family 79 C-terminal beta domain n=1 Tax=Lyophyllum shimeji TaxID=47721 RepID=A0A9P3PYQ8_LYOSH|nr:putative glycosyl hydrolase family 79 C-terminal beta domain [Lyophyllum shimeji]